MRFRHTAAREVGLAPVILCYYTDQAWSVLPARCPVAEPLASLQIIVDRHRKESNCPECCNLPYIDQLFAWQLVLGGVVIES
jgi:hypothetical protein